MGKVIEYSVVEHTSIGCDVFRGRFHSDGYLYWAYVTYGVSIGDEIELLDSVVHTYQGFPVAVSGWSKIVSDEQLVYARLIHSTIDENAMMAIEITRLS